MKAQHAVLMAALAAMSIFATGAWSAPVAGTEIAYTVDADFDRGTSVNVNHTAPNTNQLQLNTATTTFPFIWIALSGRGTIAKIDTATGTILGEYSTTSDGDDSHNPSRTTVSLDGSVWAGNRNQSSVVHVGLREANQCIDRNGNGTIETSTGYGDVEPWPGGTFSNSSAVSQAQDECIIGYVDTQGGDARHLSATATGDIWVGSYGGSHMFQLIDGDTATVLRTEGPFACGGYGGLIDGNGIIWSATSGSSVLRWNPNAPTSATNPTCIPINNYGLAIDSGGNIWVSTLGEGVVRKLAPDGTVIGTFAQGNPNAQGLAVDSNDHVWISSSLFSGATVAHLKNDGTFIGNVVIGGNGPTGIAVDAAGKIWSANINSSDATRIDPALGPIGADGVTPIGAVDLTVPLPNASPYNYSDMTGALLLGSTSPQGTWAVVQDGGAAATTWGKIVWNTEPQGNVPSGASITVVARAADTEAGLGAQTFVNVQSGTAFALTGRFLQVQVTLKPNAAGTSPVLSDIRICSAAATCGAPTTPVVAVATGQGTARLAVTKRGPKTAKQGQVVTYRISVRNTGTAIARTVRLRDNLPSGMSMAARPTGNAKLRHGRVTWTLGDIGAGASRTVVMKVRIDRAVSGRRCNTVTATSVDAPAATGRACVTILRVAGASQVPITG